MKQAAIERLKIDVQSCDHPSAFISIGSSLFLQVTRKVIKACMSSNFAQLSLGTVELAALERLEKSP